MPNISTHATIIVKFRDGVSLPYLDGLEQYIKSINPAAWDELVQLAPGCTFRRIYEVFTPETTKTLFDLAAKLNPKLRCNIVCFFRHFVLDCPVPWQLGERVLKAVRQWNEVEHAYMPPLVVPPPVGGLNSRATYQHYLRPAPLGIDAKYAWGHKGGGGTQQDVVDIEMGWTLDHVDLLNSSGVQRVELVGALNDPNYAKHGTGVLGVLCATDNDTGIVGIAPDVATARVVGHDLTTTTIPRAIELAILSLIPGVDPAWLDRPGYLRELVNTGNLPEVPNGPVLLLESQSKKTTNGPDFPSEIDPVVAELIELATAIGIVVVEAAGNGGQDLDVYEDEYRDTNRRNIFNRGDPDFLDSGAIMVGSGNRPESLVAAATPWERQADSNFGSRIDCFAWGNSVYTLDKVGYQSNFAGTSSAAAIVAGAAVSVQGMAWAHPDLRRRLTPAEVRQILSDRGPSATPGVLANTRSADPANDKIGVMPNLQHIALNLLHIPI